MSTLKKSFLDYVWDAWCCVSIIGIWPRFIEPKLVTVKRIDLPILSLPSGLEGLKIVQISDLHHHDRISKRYLDKVKTQLRNLEPDILVITGDFLCRSALYAPEKLQAFLQDCKAKYGCYAILGNHDYSEPVTVNKSGDYDIIGLNESSVKNGLIQLFKFKRPTGIIKWRVEKIGLHKELLKVLEKSPFKLLHNEAVCLPIKGSQLNICGLGEYMAGRCLPEKAFVNYEKGFPGMILMHNPDGVKTLEGYPGDFVLCGHTHGGQVNLPWLWSRFTLLENPKFKSGLHREQGKWVYVNRGIGSMMPFRFCSVPEITSFKLKRAGT